MNAVLLIAIPLLAAFLSILSKQLAPYLMLVVSFGLIVILGLDMIPMETIYIGGFDAPYGISLVLDKTWFDFIGCACRSQWIVADGGLIQLVCLPGKQWNQCISDYINQQKTTPHVQLSRSWNSWK